MKDVLSTSPLTELTIEELIKIFGGSDDQAGVLDGVFDPCGSFVVEDYDL